jgi:hypothetical protein
MDIFFKKMDEVLETDPNLEKNSSDSVSSKPKCSRSGSATQETGNLRIKAGGNGEEGECAST